MSELRSEVIVRVADVGGIVVHHCLIFFHNDKCKYIIHGRHLLYLYLENSHFKNCFIQQKIFKNKISINLKNS